VRHVTARGVSWDVEDIVLQDNPWRFWDDWERLDFEPYTLDVVDKFVTPDSCMIDIGAWAGPVSLWASRNGARVVAVEPDPVAADCLYVNVVANNANVDIFQGALNSYTGLCHIQAHAQGWGSSMTQVSETGREVPCLTMPDLFDIFDVEHCSLVKMDCEGFESILLEHVGPFLAELKIPLLVSMHQPWWLQEIDRDWLSGFSTIEGEIGGWNSVLALP